MDCVIAFSFRRSGAQVFRRTCTPGVGCLWCSDDWGGICIHYRTILKLVDSNLILHGTMHGRARPLHIPVNRWCKPGAPAYIWISNLASIMYLPTWMQKKEQFSLEVKLHAYSAYICMYLWLYVCMRICGRQRCSLVPHSEEVRGSIPRLGVFLSGVCTFSPVCVWVLSRCSGFLLLSKDMHIRLGNSTLLFLSLRWPRSKLETCPVCNPFFTPSSWHRLQPP